MIQTISRPLNSDTLPSMQQHFRLLSGATLPYPLFFPDATRGVVRAVDNQDVVATGTQGVLVNTYHLWRMIPAPDMRAIGGVRAFMHYDGAVISDSGGFQVMTLAKRAQGMGKVVDEGVWFKPPNGPRMLLSPEESVKYQLSMGTDLIVVLDDYTIAGGSERTTREAVERTVAWARRSKQAFLQECERLELPVDKRPYLIGVNQGGLYRNLRKECSEQLIEIGFDGYGYGGYSKREDGKIDMELTEYIVDTLPKDSLLYGLGVGKPDEIAAFTNIGFQIFDCVLPTRDGRHGRLYFWRDKDKAPTGDFYFTATPAKAPAEPYCDCHTCTHYSWSYVTHLFRLKETLAYRLASIHNLRFYAELMERLRVGG